MLLCQGIVNNSLKLLITSLKFVYVHRPDRFNNLAVWTDLDNFNATPPANLFVTADLQERPSLNEKAVKSFASLDARLVEVAQVPEFVSGLFLIFFNHHANSIARGVGHPPSHRLKSFPLTFIRGGLPPAIFVKEKGEFFSVCFQPFCVPRTDLSFGYIPALLRESCSYGCAT